MNFCTIVLFSKYMLKHCCGKEIEITENSHIVCLISKFKEVLKTVMICWLVGIEVLKFRNKK